MNRVPQASKFLFIAATLLLLGLGSLRVTQAHQQTRTKDDLQVNNLSTNFHLRDLSYEVTITSTQVITASPALIELASDLPAPSSQPLPVLSTTEALMIAPECNPTNGSGGLPVGTHDTTIAGQPATVIVGEGYDPQTPTYLGFYLHGDEGGYNFHAGQFSEINQFINSESWIYVAPQAPQYNAAYPWYANGVGSDETLIENNAALLRDVLDDTFAKYNVCRNILFGGSASGGSWFYDGYFFPNNGDQYPAFINIGCGSSGINGDGNNVWIFTGYYQKIQNLSQNTNILARSELKYTIGTNDFLYDNAVASANTYASLGFGVKTEYLAGVGHCAFDLDAKIRDYWQAKSVELEQGDPPTVFDHFVYLPTVLNNIGTPDNSFADEVITEVNIQRATNGCDPIVKNNLLTQAAQNHSENMALNDFVDHIDPDGQDPSDRAAALGYQAASLAENIASGQETPAEVMAAWMSSPGHRENILDCTKTEIGVGYYYLENDTGVEDNQHYWTQVFATPLN